MPATIIGQTANVSFGISNSQTGMVVQSSSAAASSDAVELKNKDGDITSVVFRNKKVTYSVEGAYTTFSTGVGTAVVVANGGKFGLNGSSFVTEVTRTKSADDFERVSFTAVVYDANTPFS